MNALDLIDIHGPYVSDNVSGIFLKLGMGSELYSLNP